jgi:hypothetical protein
VDRWGIGSFLAVAGVIGVASWALVPQSPEPTVRRRAASPQNVTLAFEARPRVEPLVERELEVSVLQPPVREPQPAEGDSSEASDAGSEPSAAVVAASGPQPKDEGAVDIPADPPSAAREMPAPASNDEDTERGLEDDIVESKRPSFRRVEIATLRAWQQPGLCASGDEASQVHASLMQRFRTVDADGVRLYVDPRLPQGAHLPVLDYLDAAHVEVRAELGLSSPSPEVFVYQDTQLLLAAACTNDDVVAYYDGALHVAVNRDDLRQSVIHEYAHHALMSNGIIGPAWAQEGIAMHVAGETWWRSRTWLERVIDRPFSIDSMESAVPYTLSSEQATLFYAQSAAMVACATREPSDGPAELVRNLRSSHSASEISYDLPVPRQPSALRACVHTLLRAGDGDR